MSGDSRNLYPEVDCDLIALSLWHVVSIPFHITQPLNTIFVRHVSHMAYASISLAGYQEILSASEGYQTIAYTENYKYTRAVVDSVWQKDTFTNRAVVEIATTWSVICRSITELEECKVMYTKSCLFITDNGREFTLFSRPLFSVHSVPKDEQLCLINAAMCCKPSREQYILIFVYNFLLCNIVGTQKNSNLLDFFSIAFKLQVMYPNGTGYPLRS